MNDALRTEVKVDPKRGLIVKTKIATLLAGRHDIIIEGGRLFELKGSWFDDDSAEVVDLSSGYTAIFQIRSSWGSSTAHLSLTQASGIALAATEPTFLVTVTAAQATTLAAAISRGWYHLVITNTGTGRSVRLEGCVAAPKRISA